jgi:NTP pyrophosphatase (non-canonical NTP hydrolase)
VNWQPFNQLNPAEVERLALLAEEMGEAIQVIGKILRHGYESTHPNGGLTNRALLEKEMGDVRAALVLMFGANDIDANRVGLAMHEKRERMRQYLHEQTNDSTDDKTHG